ncbi:MAG: helicase-related protein, partial [Oscillospiraceae bacterium]
RMSTQEDIVPNTYELFFAFKRIELVFDGYQHGMEIDELAEFIISKYQQNGNCLAIMNTKSIALRLYKKISESVYSGVRVYYLSTELCPAHRTEIIKKIRGLLDSGQPVVCVSTQLIEAGVDISFNCVVRALAGLDSIIQAAGRCNRHGNSALQNVFVVNCVGERLDMLPDILSGRQSTIKLLADFEREPEKLGGSLLSPTAICKYYGYYFFDREKNLGYSLDKHNTAVNLLGFSEKARTAFQNEYGSVFRHSLLAQAFRTVGKSFTPIAQNTTGVIIPFTGCDEELQKLFAANNFKEKSRYYRRLQKFMVNVYENRLTELMESRAIVFDEKYGIWILDKNFYSSETGISISEADKTDNYIL